MTVPAIAMVTSVSTSFLCLYVFSQFFEEMCENIPFPVKWSCFFRFDSCGGRHSHVAKVISPHMPAQVAELRKRVAACCSKTWIYFCKCEAFSILSISDKQMQQQAVFTECGFPNCSYVVILFSCRFLMLWGLRI